MGVVPGRNRIIERIGYNEDDIAFHHYRGTHRVYC